MTITREFVSLPPTDLRKALGTMPEKHPALASMILSGNTTFTKNATTYSLRGSASESRAMIEKSAAPAKLPTKRDGEPLRGEDEGLFDYRGRVARWVRREAEPAPVVMMAPEPRASATRDEHVQPNKIAQTLEGISHAPMPLTRQSIPAARDLRIQNQKDDDARRPTFKPYPKIDARLNGRPKGAA